MRELTPQEVLSLNTLLGMETTGLQVAKSTVGVMADQDLKALTESGITAAEARIRGLEQFAVENGVIQPGEVQ